MDRTIFSFTSDSLDTNALDKVLQSIENVAIQEGFSQVVKHSLRTIFNEILSNIVLHAYQKTECSEHNISINIAVTEDNTIKIKTTNCIQNESVNQFTLLLNKINLMSTQELRQIQQETLEKNLNTPGGAGIGLIMIRRRTNKPIVCNFEPVTDSISSMSLELEVSTSTLEEFEKEKTKRTPQVMFNLEKQEFEISGVSYPEDAETYYTEIEKWIDDNEEAISDMPNPVLKIDLDYFNSISLKNIARTIRDLLEKNHENFTVNWYYDVDDEISHDEGLEMSEILKKKFNFIQKN